MRNQTANTVGMLGQQQAGLYGQGAQVGAQQAAQQDIQTQRTLQLLGGLLGLRQQMTAGLPITQTPNIKQALGSALGGGGAIASIMGKGGGAGGGGAGGTLGVDSIPTIPGLA